MMASKVKNSDLTPVIANAKARHRFTIGQKFEAGIALTGTEVKSIRAGNAQITDSYAKVINGELFLLNTYIAEYEFGGESNHAPQRPRKLLLKRRELDRIQNEIELARKSVVPLKMYFKNALVKCEIAIGTGKNHGDKREDLKKRVANREADQALKKFLKG